MEVQYAFIRAQTGEFSVEALCRTFGLSRSGYYAWLDLAQSVRDADDSSRRLSAVIGQLVGNSQHEPQGELLGQCTERELLRDVEDRVGASRVLSHPPAGTAEHLRVYRDLLQPGGACTRRSTIRAQSSLSRHVCQPIYVHSSGVSPLGCQTNFIHKDTYGALDVVLGGLYLRVLSQRSTSAHPPSLKGGRGHSARLSNLNYALLHLLIAHTKRGRSSPKIRKQSRPF